MLRPVIYPKNVALLEGYWLDDAERPLSLAPLLKFLSRRNRLRWIRLPSATIEELKFNIDVCRTVTGGGILVVGFHGSPGTIHLVETKVTLEDLSSWLGKAFGKKKDWIIFFHACRTLDVHRERIQAFMANTNVRAVIGFRKPPDFVDSAAMHLLLIDGLQFYRSLPRFWSRFQKLYGDLIEMTGLAVHLNGHR